jgi:hypothetical protein
MKKIVFCDVAPCSLVDIDRRFRGVDDNQTDDRDTKHL